MKYANLWKQVLNQGCMWKLPGEKPEWFEEKIIKAPLIVSNEEFVVDNNFSYDWESFRNLAVPFDKSFWIESKICDEINNDNSAYMGSLVQPKRVSDQTAEWLLQMFNVVSRGSNPPIACIQAIIGIDKSGKLVTDGIGGVTVFESNVADGSKSNFGTKLDLLKAAIEFVLRRLLLLGCNNVSLSPRENDPKQTFRATKRHGGKPEDYRYHVLVIKPTGKNGSSDGETEIGIMPRHIARGHFQYNGRASVHGHPDGKDRGLLFGKYEGKFYIPQTTKGDKKNGTVEKDYLVHR